VPKVCYISPISIHSVRYLEEFQRKGYDTSIIADSHTWIDPRPQSTPTYMIPQLTKANFAKRYIPNLTTIHRTLKTIKPDIVHLHLQYHYSPAVILAGIPFILTSWGMEILTLPADNILLKTMARTAAWKAHKITVDANLLKRIWIQLGVPPNKIQIIPFGIDPKTFNPNINGTPIRKKLGMQKDDIVLISTRALRNHHYNVATFIRAMPMILKSCKNARFIVKGKGPLETYLKKLATKLGVTDQIHFAGLVSQTEHARYLAAADIYVSTCFVDTTSVSLLEAMATGLAPIVTDIKGNREWITPGENGLTFAPQDHKALAQQAIQLINNDDLRKQFGEKCRQKAEQASWEKCVTKMQHIYEEILHLKT
jgi:glycosyltransferase involved in cell wall biosynthesis